MLVCPECSTENSADSKFCKSCGFAVPEGDREAASQELEGLLTEGRRLLIEHKSEEAKMVAEAAVAMAPTSVAALSLLGDCFEQEGHWDAALSAYERVLEIQPDSTLDKIKVSFLRKQLLSQVQPRDTSKSKKTAALAAVAAMALVGAVGAAFFLSRTTPPADRAENSPSETSGLGVRSEGFTLPTPGSDRTAVVNANPGAGMANPSAQVQTNPGTGTGASGGSRPGMAPPAIPGAGPGQLPNALGNGQFSGSEEEGNRPLQPIVQISPDSAPERGNSGPDEDPAPPPNPAAETESRPNDPPKPERPSIVEITPSQTGGGSVNGGGSESISDSATKVETLLRVARQHFQTGNFSQAADAYEKALRAGAEVGSTNQRLAQCYERLGRKSEAIGAYRRAISAYESALRSGGNEARLKAAIEACQRAISVLGG